ncbi:type IV secretory pathway ATPase VirB11/archaellum biosynthesis ATPase [Sphingomonas sp. BK069]|nr:type IV secretory pathway ATPase VirB11/archaellum biosynthesis ATPase [Sphingomonas sp. BK069]
MRHDVPALDRRTLERLVQQIAAGGSQGVSRHSPLLAASLPDGGRVQVVMPPATRGDIAVTIRRQAVRDTKLADCAAAGLFDDVRVGPYDARAAADAALAALLDRRDWEGFLMLAVRQRRKIIVPGGSSTGKTTFLNALLRQVPHDERIVAIEDTA